MTRCLQILKRLTLGWLLIGSLLALSLPARADVVQTFALSHVTFSDGSAAEGTITYDFTTQSLVSVSISAGGAVYDNSNAAPVSVTPSDFSGQYDSQNASDTFQFVLNTPLTPTTGAAITLDAAQSTETIDTTPSGDGGTVTTLAVVSGSLFPLSSLPTTTASLAGPAGKNGWYTGPVTVTLKAVAGSHPVAATYYTLDGGASQSYTSPFAVSTEAAHALTFRSMDTAGNLEAMKNVAVNVDRTPPFTSGYSYDGVKFLYSASDNASGVAKTYYTVDGSAVMTASGGMISGPAAGGAHTLQFWSVDIAGNAETPHAYSLYTPPSVPGAPMLVSVTGTAVTLTWTASHDTLGVAGYNLLKYFPGHSGRGGGGGRWGKVATTATNHITYPLIGYGLFAVQAYDSTSHTSGQSGSAAIQGDVPPIIYPTPTGQTTAGPYAILGGGFGQLVGIGATGFSPYVMTVTGYPTPTLTVVGGPPGMTASGATGLVSWTPSGVPGTYTATIKATNPAGTASTTFTYTVYPKGTDLFAPTTPAAVPAFSGITHTAVKVSWSASTDNVGVAGYEIDFINFAYTPSYVVVKSPGTALTTTVTTLPPGSNWYVRVYAYDAAGNLSAGSPYGNFALLP